MNKVFLDGFFFPPETGNCNFFNKMLALQGYKYVSFVVYNLRLYYNLSFENLEKDFKGNAKHVVFICPQSCSQMSAIWGDAVGKYITKGQRPLQYVVCIQRGQHENSCSPTAPDVPDKYMAVVQSTAFLTGTYQFLILLPWFPLLKTIKKLLKNVLLKKMLVFIAFPLLIRLCLRTEGECMVRCDISPTGSNKMYFYELFLSCSCEFISEEESNAVFYTKIN